MFNSTRKDKLWYGNGENEWTRATHFHTDESQNAEWKKQVGKKKASCKTLTMILYEVFNGQKQFYILLKHWYMR